MKPTKKYIRSVLNALDRVKEDCNIEDELGDLDDEFNTMDTTEEYKWFVKERLEPLVIAIRNNEKEGGE